MFSVLCVYGIANVMCDMRTVKTVLQLCCNMWTVLIIDGKSIAHKTVSFNSLHVSNKFQIFQNLI